jgi:hypothetical protein
MFKNGIKLCVEQKDSLTIVFFINRLEKLAKNFLANINSEKI